MSEGTEMRRSSPAGGRNPRIAFLLSMITPGLGQVYNGQLAKGICCFAGGYLLALALCRSGLARNFLGFALLEAMLIGLAIGISAEAYLAVRKRGAQKPASYDRWYVYILAIAASTLIAGPLFTFPVRGPIGVRFAMIASSTMEPALLEGEYIVQADKPYRKEKPKRGDVVIFPFGKDPPQEFIKRIIGLEGETVEIAKGRVFIDNRPLEEPWAVYRGRQAGAATVRPVDTLAKVVVPPGFVFVLGDNRDISYDSRYYGPVETGSIRGKALYVLWGKRGRIGARVR